MQEITDYKALNGTVLQICSVEQVLKLESPSLSVIRKEHGEPKTLDLLNTIIADLALFFSVGKGMDRKQAEETSRLLLKEYYFLKVEDLKLFSDNFKLGKYGTIFDRIDGNVILEKLALYCNDRSEKAEAISLQKHKELIQAENKEQYLIKVGDNWVRSCGDDFEEIDKRELATPYTYGVAYRIKAWLVKEHYPTEPNKVKIQDRNTADGSFFDYLEKNAPTLLPKGELFKRKTNEYFEMKRKIMADETLSDFEKNNAIRQLAGLHPLTVQEYNEEVILMQKQEEEFTKSQNG